ncbi:MAG TPA: hypothetical protein VM305_02475 [Candidatus Limnocylindrales bacterium]|nr:hypothetical protein [Candidatus Limnocylindrales bacterium]
MDRRKPVATLALGLLLAACSAAPPAPSPSPSPSPEPSPSPSPAARGLYVRVWTSQALPPEHTVGSLPTLTVTEGLAIDGNVAIPMIYPGPLMVLPHVRPISEEGQAAIVELAQRLGLLDASADFSEGALAPGALAAHVLFEIDGERVELVGDPQASGRCAAGDLRCQPEPGSGEAFTFLFARLSYLDDWLADELGAPVDHTPDRLLVVTQPPAPLEVPAQPSAWPLDADFDEFGDAWAMEGSRCAVVEGDELEALLPVLLAANQATVFVDGQDEARALLARVLLPGEPSPCTS